MPTKMSLMAMPQEILLMVLAFYFSIGTVKIREPNNRLSRSGYAIAWQQLPLDMSILLVNKLIYHIGLPSFYEHITVWGTAAFHRDWYAGLSCAWWQVPWKRVRHVSGTPAFARNLSSAFKYRSLASQYLRSIDIHHKWVTYESLSTLLTVHYQFHDVYPKPSQSLDRWHGTSCEAVSGLQHKPSYLRDTSA